MKGGSFIEGRIRYRFRFLGGVAIGGLSITKLQERFVCVSKFFFI